MSYGFEVRSAVDSTILVSTEVPAMLFAGKGTLNYTYTSDYLYDNYPYTDTTLRGDNSFRYYTSYYNEPFKGHTEVIGPANANYLSNRRYQFGIKSPLGMPSTVQPVCFVAAPNNTYFYATIPYWSSTYACWYIYVYIYSSTMPETYWFYNPKAMAQSSDKYGLRVWDANDALLFDSGWGIFGSASDMVSMTFINNSSAVYSPITKPAFMYVNSYISVESLGPLIWNTESCIDIDLIFGSYWSCNGHDWNDAYVTLQYYRYLKYVHGVNDTLYLKDLCEGIEGVRESSPHPYTVGTADGKVSTYGGSSPDGGTLAIPVLNASLFD